MPMKALPLLFHTLDLTLVIHDLCLSKSTYAMPLCRFPRCYRDVLLHLCGRVLALMLGCRDSRSYVVLKDRAFKLVEG